MKALSKRTHEDIYSEFQKEWKNDIALMADNYGRTVEQMDKILFPKKHDIYTDTPLLPHLIAEQVADQGDEDMVKYLTERAERHYRDNEHFRKEINNKRKDPRQYLMMFMDHWKKAKRAFDIRNLKIPEYVPEAGDKVYSKMDFIELAKGNLKYAALLRERCTWQHPETLVEEDLREEEIIEINNTYILTGGNNGKLQH